RLFPPDRQIVEVRQRHEAGGVLSGVEALTGGVAVGIDHIAMEGSPHGRRASQEPTVEPVNVPVGVAQAPPLVVQPRPYVFRDMGSRMRKAQDDGRRALDHFHGFHGSLLNSGRIPGETLALSRPERTRSMAASRSDAMNRSSPSAGTTARMAACAFCSSGLVFRGARRSMPCAAVSASMPMMPKRFSVIARSRRAPWQAIET